MNYYDVSFSHREFDWAGVRPMACCGVIEAVIQDLRGPPQKRVEHILYRATYGGKSLLFWNVVPSIQSNAACEKYIVDLPNTTLIGEYVNKNSDRKIRTYVTNLVKEW